MKYIIKNIIWISLLLIILSCQSTKDNNKGKVVATIYGKNLYETDLKDVLYEGINYNDSVVRSRSFIDGWIRRQVLLKKAESNLTAQQSDFSKQLEDYRSSLLIYTYERELLEQNLDTIVTDEDIQKYYDENFSNFRLNENIVKYACVEISNESNKKWQFIKLLRDYDSIMVDSISSMAEKYADSYQMNVDSWIRLNDFIAEYPVEVIDQKSFLEKNSFIKIDNDDKTILIRFCDYRLVGDISPIEMEKEAISYIILNIRKKELLSKLYDDLYNKAVKERVFEIY